MHERFEAFLDDPAKTTGAITVGALALFGVVHEMMPPQHTDMVKVLGGADFLLNAACWYRLARRGQSHDVAPFDTEELFLDESA